MKMPGFTAEASLYRGRHGRAKAAPRDSATASQVVPQIRPDCRSVPGGCYHCSWTDGPWACISDSCHGAWSAVCTGKV